MIIISSFLTLAGRFKKAGGRTSSAICKGPHPLRLVVDVVGRGRWTFFELEPSDGKYLAVILKATGGNHWLSASNENPG